MAASFFSVMVCKHKIFVDLKFKWHKSFYMLRIHKKKENMNKHKGKLAKKIQLNVTYKTANINL